MTNEGKAQGGIALCAVCDVQARMVEALNSALSDWGLVEEPRNLLAPRHECDVGKQHSSGCPFYDGWMEEVSYGLLTACSASGGGLPPGITADFVAQARDCVEKAASAVRLQRQNTGAVRNPLAGQWELGAEAARTLRRFFECCAWPCRTVSRVRRRRRPGCVGLSIVACWPVNVVSPSCEFPKGRNCCGC
jgi:hypothetical protein